MGSPDTPAGTADVPGGTAYVPPGTVGQFLAGAGLLGRGVALYARGPRLLVLGLIPAVLTGLVYLAAFVILLVYVADLATWLTPFADDWSADPRQATRVLVGVGLLGLAGLLGVLTYTAVTLLVGDPFYERISERVEERLGGVPDEAPVAWWRSAGRSLLDSLRMLLLAVLAGVPLFVLGLVPVFGQTVVPVLAAVVGGWLLAVELTGVAFGRRGLRLADRRRLLRGHRPLALGFGVSVFLCFLVPLGAILVMPAAVAGGTLLARRVLGLPIDPAADPPAGMPAAPATDHPPG